MSLTGGAAHSWHRISTSRDIAFMGFADSTSARYRASTTQFFGEAGHRFDLGAVSLEPFAGLAHVSLRGGGYAENGGPAALGGAARSLNVTYGTLGLRAAADFDLGGMAATARGMVGWRRAFSAITPTATHAFAGSGAFTVAGVPIARNVAVLEAGLDVAVSPNARLSLTYSGQVGSGVSDHGANLRLGVSF